MIDELWSSEKLLEKGLEQLNLSLQTAPGNLRGTVLSLLQKYLEEIDLFNEAYGLVKVKDRRELIIKHIFDSLSPLSIITTLLANRPTVWQIADVGSGAGFPGIPLAICLPSAQFTLIERMGRRSGFLRDCIAVLGITNVQVDEKEMEKAAPGSYDTAVFRAFRPLEPVILKGLLRLLKPGGFLAAWKGRFENSREEMMAVEKSLPGLKWEILPLVVPFLEEERHLTIIRHETG